MNQWYYAQKGQQKGPVAVEELRSLVRAGEVGAEDLVWNPSMKDWLPAGRVPLIFEAAAVPAVDVPAADPSNPYSSPASTWSAPAAAAGVPLEEIPPGSEPINVMECVKRGFHLTVRNFLIIFLTGLVYFGVTMAIEIPFGIIEGLSAQPTPPVPPGADLATATLSQIQITPIGVIHQIVSGIVSVFLSMGLIRIWLNLVSGKEASVGQLFGQGDKLLRAIGATILFYLMLIAGFILLIVPGIYLALRFGQFQAAIVDKDLGVVDAFKYSSAITTNNRLNLAGLGLIGLGLMIAGLLALCVGVFFAIPVVSLSMMVAYRWMQYGPRAVQDHPGTTVPVLR